MDPAVLLQHRSQPVIFIFFSFAGTLGQISVWLRSLAEIPLKVPISLLTAPYLSGSPGSSSSCTCTCKEGSFMIPQNLIANDLVAVQHLTRVRRNALCQALLFALQQGREERGAVAGQGVGFQMEEYAFYLGGYLHFWFKKSRSGRTRDIVWSGPIYWAIEGWLGICDVLWLGHFIQRDKIQLCASAALLMIVNKSNFWEPSLALSNMRGKERKWDNHLNKAMLFEEYPYFHP